MRRPAIGDLSLLFTLVVACAGSTARLPKGTALSSTNAAEFAGPWRDAQRLRELTAKKDAQVAVLSEPAFNEALSEHLHRGGVRNEAASTDWLVALGFAEPGADLKHTLAGVMAEAIGGFYDPKAQVLFIKRGVALEEQRATLIHELNHALQDQTFGIPDAARAKDEDEALAVKALFEGDALLVMVADALEAAKAKNVNNAVPLTVGVERMRMFFASQPPAAVFDLTGQSKRAAEAPLILRETLLFPYTAGFELVTALYRSGGFVLLNEAFSRPPRSTEQVLHPEKYIAGELPIAIDEASAPAGTTLLERGLLGELGMRALLWQCLPYHRAAQAAKGWGGDRVVLARAEKDRLSASATSTWDSVEDAIEFEAAMRDVAACWAKRKTSIVAGKAWIDNVAFVARRGADVAFVRGLAEARAKPELDRLLALKRTARAAEPPLGKIALVSPPPLPETSVTRGTIEAGVYEHPRFALRSTIPLGFTPSTQVSGVDLLIRTELGTTGLFTATHTPYTAKNVDDFFRGVALAFSAQLGEGTEIETLREGPVKLLDRDGIERVLTVTGTALRIHVVVVPTCGTEWMYGFVLSSVGTSDAQELEGWLASHQETSEPPACREP